MTVTLSGFIVKTTDKSVGFVTGDDQRPLYIPISKIVSGGETDGMSRQIRVVGEPMPRVGIPATYEVDAAFAAKVGAV